MYRYVATLAFAFSAVVLGATGDISKVSGSIAVAAGQQAGDVGTVNGKLTLDGATVQGGISTVNGDVYVASGSRVDGGIHVERNSGWNWGKQPKNPRVTIESGAVVTGILKFERPVDLYVGTGVTLPAIEGVQPQRYSL